MVNPFSAAPDTGEPPVLQGESGLRPEIRPWITVALIALSVAATVWTEFMPNEGFGLLYATNLEIWMDFKWWALITSMFPHIGVLHLFYNCYWTWQLGCLLEARLGARDYFGLVAVTGWIGSASEFGVMGDMGVGLSGMVYGLFGFMWVSRAQHPAYAELLTRQTIVVMMGWLVLCFVTTAAGIMNVANFAHLGGLLAGVAIGFAVSHGRWRQAALTGIAVMGIASIVPLMWAPWLDEWHIVRADRAMRAADVTTALEALTRVREAFPDYSWAAYEEARLRESRGEYAAARDILSASLEARFDANVGNSLAWLLATCPDSSLREGTRAVQVAREVCEATEWRNSAFLDTLAAAYAEKGEFEEAIKWSLKSLENPGDHADQLKRHLEHFKAGKPWREGPPASGL